MSNTAASTRESNTKNNSAREAILARVRESIANNRTIPDCQVRFEPALALTQESLLQEFITNHTNNKSIVMETQNLQQTLQEILQENLTESGDNRVLYNPDISADVNTLQGITPIPYTQSIDEIRKELFSISTSIVQARCGVADLGILGLSSNENAPRLSSLITNTCIYLLPKSSIVQSIFAGIEFIKAFERERTGTEIPPSNMIFVAGPSRTADIELQTVFGVHGPRKTYAVLY